ncbi:hypothetical protein CEXT_421 [Caerostris extrusa]|uniref:Uncharacterized protein n=1 Tax=Caerostris extrusa TaxID=172846 RepID=A0AAV4NHW0_CAEEX|nr:hypothetical protein CEXT_421 [Caerostris extrusa]
MGGWGWRVVNAQLLPNQIWIPFLSYYPLRILLEAFLSISEQNFQCCVTAAECPDVFPQQKSIPSAQVNFRAAASNSRKRWMSILNYTRRLCHFVLTYPNQKNASNYLSLYVWRLICLGKEVLI